MATLELEISGMSCGHCVSAVKTALQELDGVDVKKVDIGSATVDYDPSRSSPAAIENAIEEAGYEVGPRAPVQLGRAAPKPDSSGR
jgi:copper ion binding protein